MTCFVTGITGHPQPATYLWHTAIGNRVPLCAGCCSGWRADVEAGTCDPPAKIEDLR